MSRRTNDCKISEIFSAPGGLDERPDSDAQKWPNWQASVWTGTPWLEQGRPITVSTQVLESLVQALHLHAHEALRFEQVASFRERGFSGCSAGVGTCHLTDLLLCYERRLSGFRLDWHWSVLTFVRFFVD